MTATTDAPWYTRISRWGQVNINEIDDPTVNIEYWIDFAKRTHLTGISISAGGSIAHYPTNIPLHRRAPFLGDRDTFGEWVAAAKAAGLRTVARLDPAFAHREVWEAHPDWILQDAQGRPTKRGQAKPITDIKQLGAEERDELVSTCWNGGYHREHYPRVLREIMERYDVDGFYTNAWPPTGNPLDPTVICHCPNCTRKFSERYGLEIPRGMDMADPAWRAYLEFLYDCVEEVQGLWQRLTKELKADATFMWNTYGRVDSAQRWKTLAPIGDAYFNDNQGRRGRTPIWQAGQSIKLVRSAVGMKPINNITGMWQIAEPSYRHTAKPAAENTLWFSEVVANGGICHWHAIGGTPWDKRWFDYVVSYYDWHNAYDRYFRNTASLAEVGLLWPQRTGMCHHTETGREMSAPAGQDAFQGWYQALLAGRIIFDVVSEERLDGDNLAQYKVLVLPDAICLSDQQVEQIEAFAARGGSIVATHETSARNEWGELRSDFGLAGVLGVSRKGEPTDTMPHCYMRIEGQHPILAGFERTDFIPGGQHLSRVEPTGDAEPLFTLIPTYPLGPPEKVYPKPSHTDIPLAFVRQQGRSRSVYFGMDLDRSYWRTHLPDHARVLANAVAWAMGETPAVSVSGPGLVDANAYLQAESLTVHLVNLSNPYFWEGPITELLPVGDQRVSINIPEGKKVLGVRLLRAANAPGFRLVDGRIEVEVPSVLDHEVVALELGG